MNELQLYLYVKNCDKIWRSMVKYGPNYVCPGRFQKRHSTGTILLHWRSMVKYGPHYVCLGTFRNRHLAGTTMLLFWQHISSINQTFTMKHIFCKFFITIFYCLPSRRASASVRSKTRATMKIQHALSRVGNQYIIILSN